MTNDYKNYIDILISEYNRVEKYFNGSLRRVRLRELKPKFRCVQRELLNNQASSIDWRIQYLKRVNQILKYLKDI